MAITKRTGDIRNGVSPIASNSLAVLDGDLLIMSGGFAAKAGATGKIIGAAAGEQTFASDNQTVAKARVAYVAANEATEYELAITGGTINQSKVGSFYNLNSSQVVNGTTEAAASTEAAPRQVILKEFISATKGIFSVVR